MPAPRKPDRTLQAAMAEAQKRKAEKVATFDAAVKRAHAAGTTDAEMAQEMGIGKSAIATSRKRQGLKHNVEALWKGARYG
jgi:hypothetical protein